VSDHFSPELFRFLRQLKRNNDREWFKARKADYEAAVRDPLLRFVAALEEPLRAVSPAILVDPRPVGGSVFRIHRDTRFAKDKTPYKTHAAAHFRHRAGSDVHAPGLYLHLEPGQVFFGAGIWHPDAPALAAIRAAILDRGAAWKKLTASRSLRAQAELRGESLKRAPKGVDPDHPLIEDLKRKDFTLVGTSSEAEAVAPGFQRRFLRFCRAAAGFNGFLASALGLDW